MRVTARAAPNCTETPAETTSATGPNRVRAEAGADGVAAEVEAVGVVVGDEEGAGMNPD